MTFIMTNNNTHGSLVISLDYELMWGVRDYTTPEEYGQTNVKQVPEVIARLQQLFSKYGVHATFATVGFIFCKDKEDAIAHSPALKPTYDIKDFSPYDDEYLENIEDKHNSLFFSPETIDSLQADPNIEVGTHTFCHYYCWHDGQTLEQFDADIKHACILAEERNLKLKSIVFPKNEVDERYLDICAKHGITVYRGNAKRFYDNKSNKLAYFWQRICRLFDTYMKLGEHSVIRYDEIDLNAKCINIPATRFIRPFTPSLSILEGQRLKHVKDEIEYAAKTNSLYHIWWHPHNFGTYMSQNFAFIEEVLKHYKYCHEKYGMQSYTMAGMADYLKSIR